MICYSPSQLERMLGKAFNYLKIYLVCSSKPDMDSGFGRPEAYIILGEALQGKECQIIETKLGPRLWTGDPAKEEP